MYSEPSLVVRVEMGDMELDALAYDTMPTEHTRAAAIRAKARARLAVLRTGATLGAEPYLLNAPLRVSACHKCKSPPSASSSATWLPGSLSMSGRTGRGRRALTAL
jgi:hypothetical protein